MRVTIIRHSIRNRGGDKLTLDYANYLIKKGYSIAYWTNEVNTHLYIDPKIIIKKIPIPGILGTIIFAFFSKFKSDVVIVDLILVACLAYFRNGKKVFYVAADYDVKYYKSNILIKFTEFCYRLAFKKFNIRAIAVSKGLFHILQKYQPKNLTIISNGVDLHIYYKDTSSSYNNQKTHPYVILLFAREDYRKGLDIGEKAIEEMSKIRNTQDWEVWTIGSAKINLSNNIKVKSFGFINTDENLKDILSVADIYIVPSRSEGLSFLLLQALACECAIVSTTAAHIIDHEINGLISPVEDWKSLANNLNTILENDALRVKLQKNARSLSEKYSLENSCKKFLKLLNAHFSVI